MKRRRSSLTSDQHRHVAAELKKLNDVLDNLLCLVGNAYGARTTDRVLKISRAIIVLTADLQEFFAADVGAEWNCDGSSGVFALPPKSTA